MVEGGGGEGGEEREFERHTAQSSVKFRDFGERYLRSHIYRRISSRPGNFTNVN